MNKTMIKKIAFIAGVSILSQAAYRRFAPDSVKQMIG